ncbi:MAG TPA: hypothetical protein VKQ36_01805, partial [Ktedonobacterales bacterium]|nr:hypothetical protein [Ktedonobacterales bacterium]
TSPQGNSGQPTNHSDRQGVDPASTDHAERERQARETLDALRPTIGSLGKRVRQAIAHAGEIWEDSAEPVAPSESDVHELADIKARILARRWVERDFLVEPDLPVVMGVTALYETAAWRVELHERGETRRLVESSDPYRGQRPPAAGPVLPLWDYAFPITPDVEAGERRERITGTEALGACIICQGTGHRPCARCEGKGFTTCPTCHGRARITCRKCRGRGRIADPDAERRARADKGYFQVQAERLGVSAAEWLADFSERLRQDYGVPLPPSGQWAPQATASGETIPCPDCSDGTLPCTCNNGKLVCKECQGSGESQCGACAGTGQVIRRREVARRFDTQISGRTLPLDEAAADWFDEQMLSKSQSDPLWEGSAESVSGVAPKGIPAEVWQAARDLVVAAQAHALATADAHQAAQANATGAPGEGERHVIARNIHVIKTPITRVEYVFGGRDYAFVAVGSATAERFWADSFPPRWNRVGRFMQALARDVSGERGSRQHMVDGHHSLRELYDYRARRLHAAREASQEDTSPHSEPIVDSQPRIVDDD